MTTVAGVLGDDVNRTWTCRPYCPAATTGGASPAGAALDEVPGGAVEANRKDLSIVLETTRAWEREWRATRDAQGVNGGGAPRGRVHRGGRGRFNCSVRVALLRECSIRVGFTGRALRPRGRRPASVDGLNNRGRGIQDPWGSVWNAENPMGGRLEPAAIRGTNERWFSRGPAGGHAHAHPELPDSVPNDPPWLFFCSRKGGMAPRSGRPSRGRTPEPGGHRRAVGAGKGGGPTRRPATAWSPRSAAPGCARKSRRRGGGA